MNKNSCSAALGSVTRAMQAGRLLAAAAIPTTVIKYDDTGKGTGGCIYGISFPCSQSLNVRRILERERIRVNQWSKDR